LQAQENGRCHWQKNSGICRLDLMFNPNTIDAQEGQSKKDVIIYDFSVC